MAHPLKNTSQFVFSSDLLEKHALMPKVGLICTAWAHLEFSLSLFYGRLIALHLPRNDNFTMHFHPISLQIFDEINTTHSRVRLVEEITSWSVSDDELKAEIKAVLRSYKKAASRRNEVVHARWAICASEPEALIQVPFFGDRMVYKCLDFDEILEGFNNTSRSLGVVMSGVDQLLLQKHP